MQIRRVARNAVFITAGLAVLAVAAGWLYNRAARSAAIHDYPPPGRIVSLDTHDMHIDCRGEGGPTVVLESGMDPLGSMSWTLQHDRMALLTRTCAYDRAGIAWSDTGPRPRDGERIASELHETLTRAGETGPFVLVAQSMGGPYARIFAGRYADRIAGIMLVESSHPEQFDRLPKNESFSPPPDILIRAMPLLREIGVVRLLMQEELRFKSLPADRQQALFAVSAGSMATVLSEFGQITKTLAQANAVQSFGDLPLIVLSSAEPPDASRIPDMHQDDVDAGHAIWLEMQQELAGLSSRGTYLPIPDASHYMQLSNTDVIVEALKSLLQQIAAR